MKTLKEMMLVALVFGVSVAASQAMTITTTGDVVLQGAIPADLQNNAYIHETETRLFFESEVTLLADLTVDWVPSETTPTASVDNTGTIAAGTLVQSYLFHYDSNPFVVGSAPPGDAPWFVSEGTATFDYDILGVIFTADRLLGTDGILGAGGTTYEPAEFFGGEAELAGYFGGANQTDLDVLTMDWDANTLDLHLTTGQGVDEVRVIVRVPTSVPDGGATAALLGAALLGLGLLGKRIQA